jgi:hypothetical protein
MIILEVFISKAFIMMVNSLDCIVLFLLYYQVGILSKESECVNKDTQRHWRCINKKLELRLYLGLRFGLVTLRLSLYVSMMIAATYLISI